MMRALVVTMLALLAMQTASGAQMRSVVLNTSNTWSTVASNQTSDATVDQVFEVFRTWDLSTEFSSAIVEARDEEADDQGRPQYYIRHKGCVLFFCLSFERNGYVELEKNEELRAYADPERSDFVKADETWTFEPDEGGTVVTYHLYMKPKFWVPPGVGPYFIKRKLKNDGGDAIDRIEVIAQHTAVEPDVVID